MKNLILLLVIVPIVLASFWEVCVWVVSTSVSKACPKMLPMCRAPGLPFIGFYKFFIGFS